MTYRYSSEPEPEPSRLASAVARPRALPFSTHRWRKKMQVTRETTRERALTTLPLFPSPRDQETHDSIGYLKQLLFGDGVLADMHNLDRFLGFSSTSHHLTRLACRTSIDAVKGTGWLAERSVYYAIDTSKPIAKDLAVGTVTELQLDVAWEKIAAASVVTWRNLVNVSFLSWTVVRPVVVFVLPFWDMVWNSVEPLLMAAKESAMDSAEDAYFTLEESVGEELGPTFREWAKALAPVVRFPGNVLRAFVAVVVRPAVYFCTYPELYGDLEIPEKPVVERLRWGEKCRKMAWSEWGECSVRCGEGYRARVNHCGKREVVRCVGPGVMGCDEICDSGAIRDCAGRCMGRAEVDCMGVCGGFHAFGCDGKCTDPPAALDAKGECCVSPTFVLPTSSLCNTTADEQTELMAEVSRLKRTLAEAKMQVVKGRHGKFRSNRLADAKAYADLERLAAEVSLAETRAGISTGKDHLEDLEEEQALHEEEEAELVAAKAELAEKLRLKRELLARSKRQKSGGWGVAAAVGSTVSFVFSIPVSLARGVFSLALSRWAVLLSSMCSFIVALRAVVQYAAHRLERELAKEDDDDADAASVTSSILTRRFMDFVVGVIADLPEAWAAYKKSREAAARAAAREKAEAEAKRAAEPPAPPKPAATKAAETAAAVAAKSAKTAVAATKTAAKTAKTAVAATKTAVTVVKRAWAKRVAVRPYVVEELAKRGKAVPAAAVLNAYETRRRCVVAMTNLSGDRSLPWRTRLRCFAALLRLSVKGGSRPYLIVSVGGFAHALRALEQWVESKTAGAPLKPGPDSALQLIRMLLDAPAVQATLMKFENVRNGEAAGVILRVLVETPGVRPVQRAGLTAMWALVRLAGPESGVAERLVEDGFYEHLEDEWEDSKEDAPTALAIGGCVMQLAMGNKKMQAVLTNLGAQALVARLFKKHAGLSYRGKFASLKTWLREQRQTEEGK